ncbi:sensor histidine kinase [Isoptericola variabilis]|uniref:histidine kinase n=1 Tax=Isoptericola variabilis (strain 225) TaxID=743718 RepID=F6FS44_ISOV2|nr:histidine kinase [Isoptericola variabilis]AEG45141.1 putative signal transduction histidine kinase [Isoptericola variabilis 225]TWH31433.1 signal transduction histidine kinase [Isoptericola variabilis J7]
MSWYERATRWFETHRFGIDVVLAAFFGLFVVTTSANVFTTGDPWDGRGGIMLWSALLVVPLAWRRTHPVASAVAVYAVALSHMLAGYPILLPADVAVLVALYAVTVHGPSWSHRVAMASTLAGCLLLTVALAVHSRSMLGLLDALPVSVFCAMSALVVWAFALVRRSRRVTLEALRDRARRLEIERDQQAQIATAAERARIAREMHDIVAHSLSIVVAQADGGRYAAASDPDAAVRSLGVISETGRAALADMRRLLGVLRSDDGGTSAAVRAAPEGSAAGHGPRGESAARPAGAAPSVTAPLAPQPDDADVEPLVTQARDAGMQVSLVRVGTPRRLPPGAGLTLHRVCQEALTNVRKHAGPDPRVTVVLRWAERDVELEVSDDGRGAAAADEPGAASDEPGYGLLGMRERAAVFGGTVTAGPRPGGGWRVRFTMPVPPAADDPDETDDDAPEASSAVGQHDPSTEVR